MWLRNNALICVVQYAGQGLIGDKARARLARLPADYNYAAQFKHVVVDHRAPLTILKTARKVRKMEEEGPGMVESVRTRLSALRQISRNFKLEDLKFRWQGKQDGEVNPEAPPGRKEEVDRERVG